LKDSNRNSKESNKKIKLSTRKATKTTTTAISNDTPLNQVPIKPNETTKKGKNDVDLIRNDLLDYAAATIPIEQKQLSVAADTLENNFDHPSTSTSMKMRSHSRRLSMRVGSKIISTSAFGLNAKHRNSRIDVTIAPILTDNVQNEQNNRWFHYY
jgi:hypothetical protein